MRLREIPAAHKYGHRSGSKLSWERWLRPVRLLEPGLLGCCQLHLTSLTLINVLPPSLDCEEWGGRPLCLGTVLCWWVSIGLVTVQLRAVFCPSVQYTSFFCGAFSWTILDSSSFPLFQNGQVFHTSVGLLTAVLFQMFFSLKTLFSYSVFFCHFHAPLDVVHLLFFSQILQVQIFSFSVPPRHTSA